MTLRRLPAAFCLAAPGLPGAASAATVTTQNFIVTAPNADLARRFGEAAEKYRAQKALEWLGQEMPPWRVRCPLDVRITQGGGGGATTFTFNDPPQGGVRSQQMEIHGPTQQLLTSVLPHEVTHTVLAHHFGRPVPRWADEGGSVLSENAEEWFNHDMKCREYLNAGRGFRLRVLFPMGDYPDDMHVLYAEGYSVCNFLVAKGGGGRDGRKKLLDFLAVGMQGNDPKRHGTPATWNAAAQRAYGFDGVDALEEAWIDSLRNPTAQVAARNPAATTTSGRGQEYAAGAGGRGESVRSSAAPAMPILEPPVKVARGTAPDNEPAGTALPAARPAAPAGRPVRPIHPPPVLLPPEIPGQYK